MKKKKKSVIFTKKSVIFTKNPSSSSPKSFIFAKTMDKTMTDWTYYTQNWNPNRQCLPSLNSLKNIDASSVILLDIYTLFYVKTPLSILHIEFLSIKNMGEILISIRNSKPNFHHSCLLSMGVVFHLEKVFPKLIKTLQPSKCRRARQMCNNMVSPLKHGTYNTLITDQSYYVSCRIHYLYR